MFGASTQRKHWTFATSDPDILKKIRYETYREYVENFGPILGKHPEDTTFFLTFEEEQRVVAMYEQQMVKFCKSFRPPLPPNVTGTAFHYYKRFYLNSSAMNYHPKDIFLTCVFLACKIEEFNVSIDEFLLNVDEKNRPRSREVIINNEFPLICALKFHLTIHNPYRAVTGLLVDLEMKRPDLVTAAFDSIMEGVMEFMEKMFFTDVIFFYSPSQIALAAVLHTLSKRGMSIDSYVSSSLIPPEKLPVVVESVKGIRHVVKRFKFKVSGEEAAAAEAKLEKCRNQENNIESHLYRMPMENEESLEDDDTFE